MPPAAKAPKSITLEGHFGVFDLAGICHIPPKLRENPVLSLRVFLFANGKTIRVPDSAGRIATAAPFKFMLAPCVAKFTEASGKSDRLVVAFTDYSLGPNSIHGAGIMCHEFPLTKAGNKHKLDAEVQLLSLADVESLSEINVKDAKYKDVHPCIDASFVMRRASIGKDNCANGLGALKFIKTDLLQRVKTSVSFAKLEIEKEHTELAKYNEQDANTQRGLNVNLLDGIVTQFEGLGGALEIYSQEMSMRITRLDSDDEYPSWLTSPVRNNALRGSAPMLPPTHMVAKRAVLQNTGAPVAAAPAAANPPPERPSSNSDSADEQAQQPAPDDVEEVEEVEPPSLGGKRNRTSTSRFAPGAAAKSGAKATKPAAAPAASRKAPKAPPTEGSRIGQPNQRTGKTYRREPYSVGPKIVGLKDLLAGDASAKANVSGDDAAAKPGVVKQLQGQVHSLQQEIAHLQAQEALKTKNAELTAKVEAQAKYMEAFDKGLQTGYAMAKGNIISGGFPMPNAGGTPGSGAGAASSSSPY